MRVARCREAAYGSVFLIQPDRLRRSVVRRLQHSACDSVFQQTRVEVDQQADTFLRDTHVREQLRFEKGLRDLDTLDLDDDEIFDDQVHLILAETAAFGKRWKHFLSNIPQSRIIALNGQG
jgi:hypothetical protein